MAGIHVRKFQVHIVHVRARDTCTFRLASPYSKSSFYTTAIGSSQVAVYLYCIIYVAKKEFRNVLKLLICIVVLCTSVYIWSACLHWKAHKCIYTCNTIPVHNIYIIQYLVSLLCSLSAAVSVCRGDTVYEREAPDEHGFCQISGLSSTEAPPLSTYQRILFADRASQANR